MCLIQQIHLSIKIPLKFGLLHWRPTPNDALALNTMFYPGPSTLCFHRLGPSKYRNMAQEHDKIMFLIIWRFAICFSKYWYKITHKPTSQKILPPVINTHVLVNEFPSLGLIENLRIFLGEGDPNCVVVCLLSILHPI